jgi:hypothetical protein
MPHPVELRRTPEIPRTLLIHTLPYMFEQRRTCNLFRQNSIFKFSLFIIAIEGRFQTVVLITGCRPPPPIPRSPRWQLEIIWTSGIPPPPPGIGERYTQTISKLCQVELLRRYGLPLSAKSAELTQWALQINHYSEVSIDSSELSVQLQWIMRNQGELEQEAKVRSGSCSGVGCAGFVFFRFKAKKSPIFRLVLL